MAYGVRESQISGGPKWLDRDRWTIEAKAEGFAGRFTREQLLQAMKSLLADRFQLRTRLETKDMPVYALVLSKGGPKVKAAAERSPFMRSGRGFVDGKSVTMDLLARTLSVVLGRPVINRTGLQGEYEVRLDWTPDPGLGAALPAEPARHNDDDPMLGSIFTEIQSELGLRLKARRAPGEIVEIVEVKRPSEN